MTIKILFFILFICLFLVGVPYYSGDIKNHFVWAQSILDFGTLGFYGRTFHNYAFPNYPPLTMSMFAISLYLYKLVESSFLFLNFHFPLFPSRLVPFIQWDNVRLDFIKLPAMIAFFGTGILIILFKDLLNKKINNFIVLAVFFLNPGIIYICYIWGQIDLLQLMLFLYAVYFTFKNKIYLSFVMMTFAALSKQTIIIFFPYLLFVLYKRFPISDILGGLILSIGIFYLAYLPFHAFSLLWPINLYKINFEMVAKTTGENAFNIWGVLDNLHSMPDDFNFLGLTYQMWGWAIFSVVFLSLSFIIIRLKKINLEGLFYLWFILTLSYFLFLTRMHERYLLPAVVISSIMIFYKKRIYFINYIFFTLLFFLNLYRGIYQPGIPFLENIVNNLIVLRFLVFGYLFLLIVNLYCLLLFYKQNQKIISV